MTFLRPLLVAAGSLLLLPCATSTNAAAADRGELPTHPSAPVERSLSDRSLGALVSGEESYVSGTHVWTDYVYDDRGPNSDLLPGGDEPPPPPPARLGTADLVQVQVGTSRRGALDATVLLRTIVQGEDALVGIGFDTDRRTRTGGLLLPGGNWVVGDAVGLEHVLTMSTSGVGHVWSWSDSTAWTRGRPFRVDVDRDANTVSAEVPRLRPGRASWNAVAVAGRVSGTVDWTTPVVGVIADLAYLHAEDPTDVGALSVPQQLPQDDYQPYQDWDQADVLAGDLPARRATATIDFGTRRERAPRVGPGFHAFLYHSTAAVPEGEQIDPRVFSSAFQPYGVWIPEDLPRRAPLVVFLHGSDQYQNVNVVYFNNPDDPLGIQPYAGLRAVTIFPNGRTNTWATPLSDRDALDSIADALGRSELRLDRDRVVVTGISSGGYGTFHLASRYPDLFTGGYSIVGGAGPADGLRATPLENLTNLPFRASNGTLDPLVDYRVWRSSADALEGAGTVDYRTVIIHTGSHNGAVAEGACFLEDLISRDRARTPGLIRYAVPPVDPALGALDILPDRAYWLRGLRHREPEKTARVHATSGALPGRVVVEDVAETGENTVSAADFCGPNPSLRRGQVWQTEGRVLEPGPVTRGPARRTITLALTNVRRARIDLRGTGVDLRRPITLDLTTDGPTRLTLMGGDRRHIVVAAGQGRERLRLRP